MSLSVAAFADGHMNYHDADEVANALAVLASSSTRARLFTIGYSADYRTSPVRPPVTLSRQSSSPPEQRRLRTTIPITPFCSSAECTAPSDWRGRELPGDGADRGRDSEGSGAASNRARLRAAPPNPRWSRMGVAETLPNHSIRCAEPRTLPGQSGRLAAFGGGWRAIP